MRKRISNPHFYMYCLKKYLKSFSSLFQAASMTRLRLSSQPGSTAFSLLNKKCHEFSSNRLYNDDKVKKRKNKGTET